MEEEKKMENDLIKPYFVQFEFIFILFIIIIKLLNKNY